MIQWRVLPSFFTAGRHWSLYAGIISQKTPVTKRTQTSGVSVVYVSLQKREVATKSGDSFGNSPHSLALSLAF